MENWETIAIIPVSIIIIMNGIFFIFAGYLVLKEFELIFRTNYLKYVKSEGKIKNYIN